MGSILSTSLLISASIGYSIISSTADKVNSKVAQQIALDWADYAAGKISTDTRELGSAALKNELSQIVQNSPTNTNIFKFKLFDQQGRLLVDTSNPSVIAHRGLRLAAHSKTAAQVIATGKPSTSVRHSDVHENKPRTYVEAYVPVKENGTIIAVAEIYVDASKQSPFLKAIFTNFALKIATLFVLVGALPSILLGFAIRREQTVGRELEIERDRAREAEASKAVFLATMSHEIRTPMNGVMGLCSSLLESSIDPDTRETVVAIHESGDSLLSILNDILDYTKMEAGQLSFESMIFSPAELVENPISLWRPRTTAKGLQLVCSQDPDLPNFVKGDVGRLYQVLNNLLSNATKFTQEGSINLHARCLRRDEVSATIEWSVSDTGIGIPQDRVDSLFNDFVQADSSINRRFGGSGLGLAICRRIVEQMGGEISASSTSEHGTIMRFSATFEISEAPAVCAHNQVDPKGLLHKLIDNIGRPLRVLIVDDNATNQLVAAKMLEEFDIQTDMASDGAEAVAAASRFRYDVILMDIQMPEMDGLAATSTIRKRVALFPAVPIIAFTANAFPDDVKTCLEAGMNDFVAKPIRKDILVGALLRVLDIDTNNKDDKSCELDVETTCHTNPLPYGGVVLDTTASDTLKHDVGEEGFTKTVEIFTRNTAAQLQSIRKLKPNRDFAIIIPVAHSIGGAAGTLGLQRLSVLCAWLEQYGTSITSAQYVEAIKRIDEAFEQGVSCLSRSVKQAA